MGKVKRLLDRSPPPDSPEYALFELLLAVAPSPWVKAERVRVMARQFSGTTPDSDPPRNRTPASRRALLPN
jgi:hypothetical protein